MYLGSNLQTKYIFHFSVAVRRSPRATEPPPPNECQEVSQRSTGLCLVFTAHLHLVPRLRMSGVMFQLPYTRLWYGKRQYYLLCKTFFRLHLAIFVKHWVRLCRRLAGRRCQHKSSASVKSVSGMETSLFSSAGLIELSRHTLPHCKG
jgi:hypothetical protein